MKARCPAPAERAGESAGLLTSSRSSRHMLTYLFMEYFVQGWERIGQLVKVSATKMVLQTNERESSQPVTGEKRSLQREEQEMMWKQNNEKSTGHDNRLTQRREKRKEIVGCPGTV